MKKYLATLLAVCLMLTAFTVPASALDYTFDGSDSGLFAAPTSDETIHITTGQPAVNRDVSKNAAVIPPTFGSPTSYTLNSGELLTPNLVSQSVAAPATGGVTVMPPSVNTGAISTVTGYTGYTSYAATAYTALTDDLYYIGGHIGTLKISAIGLTVKVYEGTDNATLAKGAGHFTNTSVWDGNIAVAAHNRGVNNHFGKIHTLTVGDTITLTTKLGTRTYEVYSVSKISVDDTGILDSTGENIITLVTCVMNEPNYRWCVKAAEKA